MTKAKKKRSKKYTGPDAAAPIEPTVYRVQAVDRGRVGQWWYEKKRIVKPVAIAVGAITIFVWLIVELIQLVAG